MGVKRRIFISFTSYTWKSASFWVQIPIISRMELEQYVQRANIAEKEIEELTKTIHTLLAEKPTIDNQEVPEELEKLRVENTKLKYRLGILQRATAEIQSKKPTKPKVKLDPTKNMLSVLNNLEDLFKEAVSAPFPEFTDA